MKQSKRILLILHILGWSLAGLLFLALDRRQQPDLVIIMGTVLDPGSMTPLPGVEVSWRSQKVTSDKAGHYEIQLPAGVREISFSAPDRPRVRKVLIVRQPGSRVRQDVLLPNSPGTPRKVLALDRGSRVGQHGKDLDSDISADSSISLADEYGNHDQLLTLNIGKPRVHSPVWLNATTIAFGKEGVLHHPENLRLLGVFQFQTDSARIQQVASEVGAHFLSKSPQKEALAIASQKDLYIIESLANPASLRRIFGLGANNGFLLSVFWGPDDQIFFTVDDSVQLDDRHYLSKSRIASMKADGTDLKPDWASDPQYSYRYPMRGEGAEIIFCRFALDGKQQTLWSRNLRTGKTKLVAEPALRAVHMDSSASRLYYIYQQNLHLRDLKSGADWVIVNSVKEA
ncbi:MAG: carboxypeptidase-like regulatory domain-containing protein, partial [Terriglobia bacterium]